MNNLDEELRRALGREEPPAGFAERVLERLPAATSNVVPISARGRKAPRFALAAAAALAVMTAGVWYAIPRGDSTNAKPETTMLLGVEEPGPPPPPTPNITSTAPKAKPAPRRHVRPEQRPSTEDAEALRAAEQLRLALHITGDTLNVARREVRESAIVPPS